MKYMLLAIFIAVVGCSSDDTNNHGNDADQTLDTSFDGSTEDADVSNIDLAQGDVDAETDTLEPELRRDRVWSTVIHGCSNPAMSWTATVRIRPMCVPRVASVC